MEMDVKVRVTIATSQDKKEAAMTVLNGHVVVSWEHWSLKYKKILIYDFSMGVVHVILD